jgi:hypothetical protein
MDRKVVNRLFIWATLVAIVASASAAGNQSATISPDQLNSKQVADGQSAPIVLAQGRCFNGRCY